MTTTNEIDWSVLNTGTDKETVALKEVPLDTEVSITFDRVFNTPSGNIGAEVNTFTFTRISSEKSPAGYAYRWTA